MKTNQHYENIASKYNNYYQYSIDYITFFTKKIVETLKIHSNDIVFELGAGTGIYAQEILKRIDSIDITCIDNNQLMLDQIASEVIKKRCIDALNFSKEIISYDKIYMKEFIHHIPQHDRIELFKGIYRQLRKGGAILILVEPKVLTYPLFKDALRQFELAQPSHTDIIKDLTSTGFKICYDLIEHPITVPKDKYIEMVKNRYMSVLSNFNDTEISTGINFIKTHYNDQIIYQDIFYCIHGEKI